MNQTSNYYNQHAQAFFENTYQVEMESLYALFLRYLPEQALILDLGCGSGRDTLAFKKKGYQVEAIDYSIELVEKARELTGIEVRQQSFYELNEVAKYDGIWACALPGWCDVPSGDCVDGEPPVCLCERVQPSSRSSAPEASGGSVHRARCSSGGPPPRGNRCSPWLPATLPPQKPLLAAV